LSLFVTLYLAKQADRNILLQDKHFLFIRIFLHGFLPRENLTWRQSVTQDTVAMFLYSIRNLSHHLTFASQKF